MFGPFDIKGVSSKKSQKFKNWFEPHILGQPKVELDVLVGTNTIPHDESLISSRPSYVLLPKPAVILSPSTLPRAQGSLSLHECLAQYDLGTIRKPPQLCSGVKTIPLSEFYMFLGIVLQFLMYFLDSYKGIMEGPSSVVSPDPQRQFSNQ